MYWSIRSCYESHISSYKHSYNHRETYKIKALPRQRTSLDIKPILRSSNTFDPLFCCSFSSIASFEPTPRSLCFKLLFPCKSDMIYSHHHLIQPSRRLRIPSATTQSRPVCKPHTYPTPPLPLSRRRYSAISNAGFTVPESGTSSNCLTRRYCTTEYKSKPSPPVLEYQLTSQADTILGNVFQNVRLGRISIYLRPHLNPTTLLLPLRPLRSLPPVLRRQGHQADLGQARCLPILPRSCTVEAQIKVKCHHRGEGLRRDSIFQTLRTIPLNLSSSVEAQSFTVFERFDWLCLPPSRLNTSESSNDSTGLPFSRTKGSGM